MVSHMKAEISPDRYRLTDGEVTLRPFVPGDKKRLAELGNNVNIFRNLRDGFPHPYTITDAERFIAMVMEHVPPHAFAIEYQGEYVGNIGIHPKGEIYRLGAEIGYFLGEAYWHRGIMPRAVRLACDYAFRELAIIRIDTGVFDYNMASQRVLEKCGFVREGVFRKSVIKMGRICDEVRYALLKEEG